MTHRKLLTACALAAICAAALILTQPAAAAPNRSDQDDAAPSRRTRVEVYPRRRALGPNAVRQCRAWLEQEYRVSGTVIVPRQQCWWE